MSQPQNRKQRNSFYSKELKPVKVEYEGLAFDSIAEKNFYVKLKKIFPSLTVLRPCNVELQGKSRKWRCDFGLIATTFEDAGKLSRLVCIMQGREFDHACRSLVYVEFKGKTDLGTGFIQPDNNFLNRVDHLVRYERDILNNTIFIGAGIGGALLTYCQDGSFCVTPIHVISFLEQKVKELW